MIKIEHLTFQQLQNLATHYDKYIVLINAAPTPPQLPLITMQKYLNEDMLEDTPCPQCHQPEQRIRMTAGFCSEQCYLKANK